MMLNNVVVGITISFYWSHQYKQPSSSCSLSILQSCTIPQLMCMNISTLHFNLLQKKLIPSSGWLVVSWSQEVRTVTLVCFFPPAIGDRFRYIK